MGPRGLRLLAEHPLNCIYPKEIGEIGPSLARKVSLDRPEYGIRGSSKP